MRIVDKIRARTSKQNRIKGQVSTIIGGACAVVLGLGLVTVASPILFGVLAVGAVLFGGDAGKRALKTK